MTSPIDVDVNSLVTSSNKSQITGLGTGSDEYNLFTEQTSLSDDSSIDGTMASTNVPQGKAQVEDDNAESSQEEKHTGKKHQTFVLKEINRKEKANHPRSSLKHMHELYETVSEITEEPVSKDQPDVKAFFKVLKNHSLQSKLVYVVTVVSIVAVSHFTLSVQWLLPYYYAVATPVMLLSRFIMYWRMKYQYFLLDFCYFANLYWYAFIWIAPHREDIFAVAFAVANGPLIWALFVFRNSLVFHSLDKVNSMYIHILPPLMSYAIRWYPKETSRGWYREFPECGLGFSILWLIVVPFAFGILHQISYGVLVNLILRPSEEYLNTYRYLLVKENTLIFRMCNLLGPRFRYAMYSLWWQILGLFMLAFNLIWYNYFVAHCIVIIVFIIVAIFNGATYYIDVFRLQSSSKKKSGKEHHLKNTRNSALPEHILPDTEHTHKAYGTLV